VELPPKDDNESSSIAMLFICLSLLFICHTNKMTTKIMIPAPTTPPTQIPIIAPVPNPSSLPDLLLWLDFAERSIDLERGNEQK